MASAMPYLRLLSQVTAVPRALVREREARVNNLPAEGGSLNLNPRPVDTRPAVQHPNHMAIEPVI